MSKHPIVIVIPDAHEEEGDAVALKECWMIFCLGEINHLTTEENARCMNVAVNTLKHYRTDMHHETGCRDPISLCIFMEKHKLAKKQYGQWKWIATWKQSPHYLKKPIYDWPKRPLK